MKLGHEFRRFEFPETILEISGFCCAINLICNTLNAVKFEIIKFLGRYYSLNLIVNKNLKNENDQLKRRK